MKKTKAVVKLTYSILSIDADGAVIPDGEEDDGNVDLSIDQHKGDQLEVWKEREDGFLFVFCNNHEIGYWVNPRLVEVI